MVDSSPSDGERDPATGNTDRPSDESEESDETDETDDQWVAVIEALAARVDPVPDEVLQAARRALGARDENPSARDEEPSPPDPGDTET